MPIINTTTPKSMRSLRPLLSLLLSSVLLLIPTILHANIWWWDQGVGTQCRGNMTYINGSDLTLEIETLAIDGPDKAAFRLIHSPSKTIPPHSTYDWSATFKPLRAGSHEAWIVARGRAMDGSTPVTDWWDYDIRLYGSAVENLVTVHRARIVRRASGPAVELQVLRNFGRSSQYLEAENLPNPEVWRGNRGTYKVNFSLSYGGKTASYALYVPSLNLVANDQDPERPDPQPVRISLSAFGMPRLDKNQIVKVSATVLDAPKAPVKSDTRKMAVLLPVVVVPGIASQDPASWGGDGEFPQLTAFLKERSANALLIGDGTPYLGEPYVLDAERADNGPFYWTLSTLSYPRNRSSIAAGAEYLKAHIQRVLDETWASKVYVLAHGYGGLCARKYIQADVGKDTVKSLIMLQCPNLGSAFSWSGVVADSPFGRDYNYPDMKPIYPWMKFISGNESFQPTLVEGYDRMNPVLASLNGLSTTNDPAFPTAVPITAVYSSSERTCFGAVWKTKKAYYCKGDGLVPAFSQLGLLKDPNSGVSTLNDLSTSVIPAFSGVRITRVNIPGAHVPGFPASPSMEDLLIQWGLWARPTMQTQYLESQAVLDFLWDQRLSEGIVQKAVP